MSKTEIPSLSRKELIIMKLMISGRREMYGLELVDNSEGKLKRGSIYVTLGRLEDKGYVVSRREEQRPGIATPRRLYRTTGLGAKVFNAIESAGGRKFLREVFA